MELIWCFIFVLLGKQRGKGGLGPGTEQPPRTEIGVSPATSRRGGAMLPGPLASPLTACFSFQWCIVTTQCGNG